MIVEGRLELALQRQNKLILFNKYTWGKSKCNEIKNKKISNEKLLVKNVRGLEIATLNIIKH